jgi:L-2-hydroxyglutarate oxidase LhgO
MTHADEAITAGAVVIGAGAIGLSIAAEMSRSHDVLVLEAESTFGTHTSSRNSEVIHSGIYYRAGSNKSNLCLAGKTKLYSYLDRYDIPYSRCGKLIVAAEGEELQLGTLAANAILVGVPFEYLDGTGVTSRCPEIKAAAGMFLPETGFFDSHLFMKSLTQTIFENDGHIQYGAKVAGINSDETGYLVTLQDGTIISTEILINSAGLCSDHIAGLAGAKDTLSLYKGEYYITDKIKNLPHLIYSVPPANQLSLGIHTRHYLDGRIGFGPNAYPVDTIDYTLDDGYREEFLRDINRYFTIPFEPDDIRPDYSGIRPKTNGGTTQSDFVIRTEPRSGRGLMISLIGIESPGLTCSLSIAEMVADLVEVDR